MFIMFAYMIFKNMLSFAQHPTTFLIITWFFGLAALNILITITIYGYYYYKTNINPFSGIQGPPGYEGISGTVGTSTVDYKCKDKNN